MRSRITILLIGLIFLGLVLLITILPASARNLPPAPGVQNIAAAASAAIIPKTLCAKTGTTTMPDGAVIPILGYVDATGGSCASVTLTKPGGPILTINSGDTLQLTLVNDLPYDTSLMLSSEGGESMSPISADVPSGMSVMYSITPVKPGLYLYESGTEAEMQVTMGLYGALLVNSTTPGQAYDSTNSSYDAMAVLVLSEIDPVFNAAPTRENLLNYAPRYWLINGEAYPDTDAILADAGDRVLLRFLNAGSLHHTMSILNAHQSIIAKDGFPITFPYDVIAETIPAGQTVDTIATIPVSAVTGSSMAIYNRQLHLTNSSTLNESNFPGGMMTFINIQIGAGVVPTPPPPPPPPSPALYLSLSKAGSYTVGTVAGVSDEDILSLSTTGAFAMFFDGSQVGVGALDLDAFFIASPSMILMSFDAPATIPGVGLVDDSDIVRFTASSLGSTTAGAFTMFFDASLVGLDTNGEDVDAIEMLADGRLLVSTIMNFSVPGVSGMDEDLIAFTPTTPGVYTSGTWAMYFDGSDVGLGTTDNEDVNGVAVSGSTIYLSTLGSFSVTGVAGTGEDVFACGSAITGAATTCSFAPTLTLDGSSVGLLNNPIDAIGLP